MKVAALIEALQQMPPDAEVAYIWDGRARSTVEYVWYARTGQVMLADYGCTVYSADERPLMALEAKYWTTPNPHDVFGNDPITEDIAAVLIR